MPQSLVPYRIDDGTVAFLVAVPEVNVVFFQGLFETYEGLGTVRTVDKERSLIAVFVPNDLITECEAMLIESQSSLGWSIPQFPGNELPPAVHENLFLMVTIPNIFHKVT